MEEIVYLLTTNCWPFTSRRSAFQLDGQACSSWLGCRKFDVRPESERKPARTDLGVKSSLIFFESCQKVSTSNIAKYFGYFCKELCSQELSKIPQPGHTDWETENNYEARCNQSEWSKSISRTTDFAFTPTLTNLPMASIRTFQFNQESLFFLKLVSNFFFIFGMA